MSQIFLCGGGDREESTTLRSHKKGMPRRRGRLAGQPRDHSDSPCPSSDSVVLNFAFYWVYAHLNIALKCVKKLNDLLFRFSGYDRLYDRLNIPHGGILYWRFTVVSIPLMLLFIQVVMKFAPVFYIVLGEVIFMCIFWVLDSTR